MNQDADFAATRIHPARTLAISVALVLHAGAFAVLVAPVRPPDLAPTRALPQIEVVMQERRIPPPPAPPQVPIAAPRPTPAVARPAPQPPVAIPNPVPAESVADVVPDTLPVDLMPSPDTGDADRTPFLPAQIGALSYLDAPPPRYPTRAIAQRLRGEVLLRVTVGTDGRPETVELQQGSGHAVLDRAAIDQVRKRWRFRPLIVDGLPSRAVGLVPIRFSLED